MPDNPQPPDILHPDTLHVEAQPGVHPAHPAAESHAEPDDGCKQVLRELQTFIDAECGSDLERSIRRHLSECSPCLDRADFQAELKALIARKCSQAAPSGLIDRVVASLRAAGGGLESSNGRWGGA